MKLETININRLINRLPHGSGIDSDWELTTLQNGKVRCENFFHAMDEHGGYVGYMPFSFTVVLVYSVGGYVLVVSNIRCNENRLKAFYGLRDYLTETIDHTLSLVEATGLLQTKTSTQQFID